jgi:hypothetical protein
MRGLVFIKLPSWSFAGFEFRGAMLFRSLCSARRNHPPATSIIVGHHTCQFEASFRIAAIMVHIHCFDPYSPTKLDHNAIGE